MNRITSVLPIQMGDIYTFLSRMGSDNSVKQHRPCFEYHLLFYNIMLTSNPTPQNLSLLPPKIMNYSRLILRPLDGQKKQTKQKNKNQNQQSGFNPPSPNTSFLITTYWTSISIRKHSLKRLHSSCTPTPTSVQPHFTTLPKDPSPSPPPNQEPANTLLSGFASQHSNRPPYTGPRQVQQQKLVVEHAGAALQTHQTKSLLLSS